jgi:hypothetical protein
MPLLLLWLLLLLLLDVVSFPVLVNSALCHVITDLGRYYKLRSPERRPWIKLSPRWILTEKKEKD